MLVALPKYCLFVGLLTGVSVLLVTVVLCYGIPDVSVDDGMVADFVSAAKHSPGVRQTRFGLLNAHDTHTKAKQSKAKQSKADRTKANHTKPNQTEPNRTEPNRTEQNRTEQNRNMP